MRVRRVDQLLCSLYPRDSVCLSERDVEREECFNYLREIGNQTSDDLTPYREAILLLLEARHLEIDKLIQEYEKEEKASYLHQKVSSRREERKGDLVREEVEESAVLAPRSICLHASIITILLRLNNCSMRGQDLLIYCNQDASMTSKVLHFLLESSCNQLRRSIRSSCSEGVVQDLVIFSSALTLMLSDLSSPASYLIIRDDHEKHEEMKGEGKETVEDHDESIAIPRRITEIQHSDCITSLSHFMDGISSNQLFYESFLRSLLETLSEDDLSKEVTLNLKTVLLQSSTRVIASIYKILDNSYSMVNYRIFCTILYLRTSLFIFTTVSSCFTSVSCFS